MYLYSLSSPDKDSCIINIQINMDKSALFVLDKPKPCFSQLKTFGRTFTIFSLGVDLICSL